MIYQDYSILGQAQGTTRQFALDPRAPLDWAGPVPLQPAVYQTVQGYDALRRPLSEQTPDGSVIGWRYALSGRLAGVTLRQGTSTDVFVTDIAYNANDQRERLYFGNQAIQTLSYEATTERLLTLDAQRPAAGPDGAPRDPTVQQASYAYDPVGNLARMHDRTAEQVFRGGAQPEALGDYRYDALYRLSQATGLQHPDIKADTHLNGFMQSLYAELCPAPARRHAGALRGTVRLRRFRQPGAHAPRCRQRVVPARQPRAGRLQPSGGRALRRQRQHLEHRAARADRAALGRTQQPDRGRPGGQADGASEQVWMSYDFTNTLAQRVMERSAAPDGPPSCARRS